jgi:hypothetical protein
MFESSGEIYFSDYNSPSIQTKNSGIKKSKKILFTPTDSLTPQSKQSRTEKHLKTMKIKPSFIHKFQSVALEKDDNIHSFTPIKQGKNKLCSFTDYIQPIILKNNKIKSYSNVQKKNIQKKQ